MLDCLTVGLFSYDDIEFDERLKQITYVTGDAEKLYSTTVICYFSFTCLLVSDKLQVIGQQIRKLCTTPSSVDITHDQFRRLQNNHMLICRAVELINQSFGIVLLLEMLFIFIDLTNNIMDNVLRLQKLEISTLILCLVLIVISVVNLMLVCYSAEKICTEVIPSYYLIKGFRFF